MQQLIEDMSAVTESLETVCDKMVLWKNKNIFEEIREIVSPVTTLITIVFNNKELLESLSLDIRESEISECINGMMNGLEQRDETGLLDSMHYGLLPWFRGMINGMSAILKQQEE